MKNNYVRELTARIGDKPCRLAREWLRKLPVGLSWQEIWDRCKMGHWLVWLINLKVYRGRCPKILSALGSADREYKEWLYSQFELTWSETAQKHAEIIRKYFPKPPRFRKKKLATKP